MAYGLNEVGHTLESDNILRGSNSEAGLRKDSGNKVCVLTQRQRRGLGRVVLIGGHACKVMTRDARERVVSGGPFLNSHPDLIAGRQDD